ncbi:Flp pilus assembly protein CpaB [Aureimonas leprariae]|uniref:Flp pilus assembly protein CpaB n=1 Tax=Plantimonas leprariae TaxID=2615207 RepID=A0A7V7PSV5_9HYPH|nr:Flp pilus assembly protein CpaB [Aureimonas leprariae]KAB0682705.1 Flp pilus assembly protein CpaB [Aureimonas leprariae]
MNVSRLVVLGAALLAAVGAGYVALQFSTPPPAEPVIITAKTEPAVKLAEVLVATRDIAMGATVDGALGWQSWPQDALGPALITRTARPDAIESLKGVIARQSFATGEPVRDSKLVRTDHGFMSVVLPAGKRAMSVQISAETAAGGFILPNDHVDVIMTRKSLNGGQAGAQVETETVLANIRVLAIDQTIEEQEGAKVVVGSTATLEVDPKQAEALTAAQQIADRLVLSLRSLEDSVPGGSGYAAFLLAGEPKNGKVRVVRYGQPTEINAKR